MLGGQKRKDRKTRRRNEERELGFSSSSLFHAMKREGVIQGGTRGIDPQHGGKPREPVSSKAGKTSETVGTLQIHLYKTRVTRALGT